MYEIEKDSFICVQDEALPASLCDEIISFFEQSEKKFKGRVVDANGNRIEDEKERVSTDLDLSGEAGSDSKIDRELYRLVNRAFNTYVDMFGVLRSFSINDTSYFVTRYPKGEGFYDWHIDAANEATINRIFSCVVYLNTVDEGGETEFFYQKLSVKPKKGRLILFPSSWTHLHRGAAPVSSDKFIMTTFLTHQRSQLC